MATPSEGHMHTGYCSRSTPLRGRLGILAAGILLLLLAAIPSQAQPPCRDVCLDVTAPNDTTVCSGATYTGRFLLQNCNVNTTQLRGLIRPVGRRGGGVGLAQHYVLTAT